MHDNAMITKIPFIETEREGVGVWIEAFPGLRQVGSISLR